MTVERYDVAVVGGRTIGANSAARFADRGFDVLLLERNETVGSPLACSGHFSRDIWEYVPDAARDLVQNEIRGARFHAGSGTYRFFKDRTVSWAVDRQALDRMMFEHAAEAGADARTGHALRDWEETEEGRELVVESGGDAERVEASLVVGADGAASTVRRLADLPDPRRMMVGMMAFTDEPDADDFVDVHLEVPGFFGWRIPRGGSVEYGVAVERSREVQDHFERFMERYAPEVPEQRHAATIPMLPPDRVTGERSLLVGDAAGQTKPFTGGGVVYGLRAGTIAAETVDPRDPDLDAYEDEWRDALSTEIRLGEWLRKAYSLPTVLQRPALRLLSGDISGIHMDRPSTLIFRE